MRATGTAYYYVYRFTLPMGQELVNATLEIPLQRLPQSGDTVYSLTPKDGNTDYWSEAHEDYCILVQDQPSTDASYRALVPISWLNEMEDE